MGIFNRLFGQKQGNNTAKNSNNISFNSTDELMDEERFWKIIDKANKNSKGNYEKELEIIEEELRKLSPADIIIFSNRFRYFRGKANTWELWGAIYLIHGGCGDDSFNDFREWVIAQGKDFYYRTVKDPETLIEIEAERIEEIE